MAATSGCIATPYTKEIAEINESLLDSSGMDKKTQTWLEIAENDLEFAEQILKNRQRPHYACNECHQAIEKILKGIIQEKMGKPPPRIHNLFTLAEQTELKLSENQQKFILKLSPHYMGTRYPEDLADMYKKYTYEYASALFDETKELFLWLKNCLIQKNW